MKVLSVTQKRVTDCNNICYDHRISLTSKLSKTGPNEYLNKLRKITLIMKPHSQYLILAGTLNLLHCFKNLSEKYMYPVKHW